MGLVECCDGPVDSVVDTALCCEFILSQVRVPPVTVFLKIIFFV